ncbi:MAG: ABC transporter substrate-binding protein [Chloroflexi bacterium]|nr:MAG: ABC transporter substrate-binding protein [Chloroflexota bacterium]TME17889.1 MAG: ABC transporter substrate-binding protein [Chloroflexota bacterium]
MQFDKRRLFTLLGAIVTLAACGGTSPPSTGGVQTVDVKLMVGGLNKQIYLPNMLAKQLGYFDEQKINITFIDEGSGQATEEEVVAQAVDAGSGAYSHAIELNALGKKIETICQFGIAPGEAEMVDAKKASSITSVADLKGKNLGVTDIGSGTHTITLALLGKAGIPSDQEHFVAVGAGNTFIAAIQQQKIDAGMTTEPTISRLLTTNTAKVLVDLRTPQTTRAALGGDYPFIGIFARNDWVSGHKDVAQRLVNVYVKTLKFIHSHTAAQIADKMPADYYAGDKNLYVTALQNQLSIFGTDCKMPAAGPQTVLDIEKNYVSNFKGKTAKLSETYTNEFANKASA